MKIYVFQTIEGSDSLVRGEKFNSIEVRPNKSTHDFFLFSIHPFSLIYLTSSN